MKSIRLFVALSTLIAATPAHSQTAKEIRTTKGKATALTNLVALRQDCTIGLVDIPNVTTKPSHGDLQQAVATIDLPPVQNCPAKPATAVIAIVYAPNDDFVGTDKVSFEVHVGGHLQNYTYTIAVSD